MIQFSLIFILNFFLFPGSCPGYHITFKFFLSTMPSQIFLVFECFLLNFSYCHMSINFSYPLTFFKYKCNTILKVFFFFSFCRCIFRLIFSFPPTPLLHLSWEDWLMISNSNCEKSCLKGINRVELQNKGRIITELHFRLNFKYQNSRIFFHIRPSLS